MSEGWQRDEQMAERKPTQELLELDVGEISLVDVPANEQKFHVIKRHEEPTMADEPTTTEPTTTSDPAAPQAASATPAADGGTPEVIAKTFADLQSDYAELEKAYAEVEKVDAGKAANLLNQMMGLMGQMRSALKAGFGKPPPPGGVTGGTSEKTQKAADDAADDAATIEPPLFSVDAQGGVHFSGEQISKGRIFTQSRTATVKNTMTQLAMLLKEVDPTGLVELLDKLKADLPKDPGFSSAVRPTATGPGLTPPRTNLRKDADGNDIDPEDEVMKMLKNLGARIEKFEKERNPSQSVEDDGDTADVTKQAGMWNGVL